MPSSIYTTDRILEIKNLFAIICGGIFIKFIFNSQGPANATIWGYSLSVIAIFFLLMISISFTKSKDFNFNNFIKYYLPSCLLIIIFLWAIGLTVSYFKKINTNILPKEFNTYSFISTSLIIIQIIIFYKYFNEIFKFRFNKSESEDTNNNLSNNDYIMYILSILNLIILGIMQIILQFFTTDG